MSLKTMPALRLDPVRMLSCLTLALAFLLSGFELPGQAGQGVTATGARVAGDESRTRFVADVTQSVSFTVYVLPDPYRVMIDLPDVSFDLPPGSGQKTRGLIKEYRYGQVDQGRARIVLDAKGPVLIEKSFIVPPQAGQPARIVVDLVPTTGDTFAATLKLDELSSMAAIADAEANQDSQDRRDGGESQDSQNSQAEEPPGEAAPAASAVPEVEPAEAAIVPEAPDELAAIAEDVLAAVPDEADVAQTGEGNTAFIPKPVIKPETRSEPEQGAATVAPIPEKPAAPERKNGRKLIVIDPGHGGIDPGAIGVKKTKEKDVVLAFALELRDRLEAQGNVDVVLTRSADEFLTLKKRVRIARDHAADLFIAVHADTVRGPAARGATIYTLSEKASDAEAEALAHKENRADIIGGVDLDTENEEVTDILIDLVQRESKNHSLYFARHAVAEMKGATGFTGKPMRSAGFMVLKAPDVPSVLVELGYLSSKQDEQQLTSPKWRANVAAAMARAVDKYFSQQLAQKSD
jgi:N-acetylmuramoyl-L-alanine amidase